MQSRQFFESTLPEELFELKHEETNLTIIVPFVFMVRYVMILRDARMPRVMMLHPSKSLRTAPYKQQVHW
jgi:hypothetical protein